MHPAPNHVSLYRGQVSYPAPTPHLPKGGKTACFQNVQRLLNTCSPLFTKLVEPEVLIKEITDRVWNVYYDHTEF